MSKAWMVSDPGEWSQLIYAETRGKARQSMGRDIGADFEEAFGLSVRRVPVLDGTGKDDKQAYRDAFEFLGWDWEEWYPK